MRHEDRYSDLLQTRLPEHFEVLNFGTPGANTPRASHLVATPAAAPSGLRAAAVVRQRRRGRRHGGPAHVPSADADSRGLHGWLNDASALYTVANMQWAEAQVALGHDDRLRGLSAAPAGRSEQTRCQVDRAAAASIDRALQAAGVADRHRAVSRYGRADRRRTIRSATCTIACSTSAASRALPCLDLREDFALVKDHQSLWANRLDHHPSARANEIAAVKILETLLVEVGGVTVAVTPAH